MPTHIINTTTSTLSLSRGGHAEVLVEYKDGPAWTSPFACHSLKRRRSQGKPRDMKPRLEARKQMASKQKDAKAYPMGSFFLSAFIFSRYFVRFFILHCRAWLLCCLFLCHRVLTWCALGKSCACSFLVAGVFLASRVGVRVLVCLARGSFLFSKKFLLLLLSSSSSSSSVFGYFCCC